MDLTNLNLPKSKASFSSTPYELANVNPKDPDWLMKLGKKIVEGNINQIIDTSFLPLDKTLNESKDPQIMKAKEFLTSQKVLTPFCGRWAYLGSLRIKDGELMSLKDSTLQGREDHKSMLIWVNTYKAKEFLPTEWKEGEDYPAVSAFCDMSPKVYAKLEQMLAVMKAGSIPENEIAIAFITSNLRKGKKKEGYPQSYNIDADDLWFFRTQGSA